MEEQTNLYKLAFAGDLEQIRARLQMYTTSTDEGGKLSQSFVLRSSDDDGRTPLHWAAAGGKLDVVEFLADLGSPIETKDESEWSPLMSAASAGHVGVVRFLLARGANALARNEKRQIPLHYHRGNPEIVNLLLQSTPRNKVNSKDAFGITPLHKAALIESEDGMRSAGLLIEAGANVNVVNDEGNTPLHLAAEYGNAQMASYLVRHHGANVDVTNAEGKTPLQVAPYATANVLTAIDAPEETSA